MLKDGNGHLTDLPIEESTALAQEKESHATAFCSTVLQYETALKRPRGGETDLKKHAVLP